ncbi:hypothetical protein OUZ56_023904 [Daphnia magna]|uniref:Uncharacterized protein n=1 Tax=Daphnia magna TaxID=35525 RepID=A0ABR0AZU5_9CRUS|nr:hypothetical protein OUZ56_023904 [Daphnia magna]
MMDIVLEYLVDRYSLPRLSECNSELENETPYHLDNYFEENESMAELLTTDQMTYSCGMATPIKLYSVANSESISYLAEVETMKPLRDIGRPLRVTTDEAFSAC